MRYTLIVFIILLSQISHAQHQSNWIIEVDSGYKVFIGTALTTYGIDSVQIISDSSIIKLATSKISKITYDKPGKSGLIPGIIGGLAGGLIFATKFDENNRNNLELQPEDKFVATVLMSQLGLLAGFSLGFFPFNRWHRHHNYYFDGLTPAQKIVKLRELLKKQ